MSETSSSRSIFAVLAVALFLISLLAVSAEPSYFVLSNTTYTSDLGNLTGANEKCYTDLSAEDWLGKENVTLTASKVEAFLCSSLECSRLLANTTYYFARSGNATVGGASFTTNGSGIGPGDTTPWSGLTYFNVTGSTEWFSNRAPDDTDAANYFTNTPANNFYGAETSCTDWTTAAFGTAPHAGFGSAEAGSNTGRSRYANNNGVDFCGDSGELHLICAVNGNANDLPVISEINLSSTDPGNYSSENLSVSLSSSDANGDEVRYLYNWQVNGSSLALINMPFEKVNNTGTENFRDYALNRTATSNGAIWNVSGGHDGKGAYLFEGDGYINVSGSDLPTGTTPRTLCAWVRSNDTGVDGNADHIVNYGTAQNGQAFGFMLHTGDQWRFYGHGGAFDFGSGVSADTDWHHHCVSYDGSLVIYHLDGAAVANASRTLSTTGGNMTFGLRPDLAAGNYFDGYIDEVMLFNRSLSAAQINVLYRNQTSLIVSQETTGGDNWSVTVTPNDGKEDGASVNSENLTIRATDTDRDGFPDSTDRLLFNESNVTHEGLTSLNITIGGNSTNGTYSSGVEDVLLYDQSSPLVNFSHNFTQAELNLKNVVLRKSSLGLVINLSGQLQNHSNKTLWIDDNSFTALCAKDAEIGSLDEISAACTGDNETDLTSCLGDSGGVTLNGIACVDEGSRIKISNLRYSGVKGTTGSSSSEDPGSSGSPTGTVGGTLRLYCGDGTCSEYISETCSSCPLDCGACPATAPEDSAQDFSSADSEQTRTERSSSGDDTQGLLTITKDGTMTVENITGQYAPERPVSKAPLVILVLVLLVVLFLLIAYDRRRRQR